MTSEVMGVVLAGGKSSRMGRDKGTMETDGVTWTQSAIQRFADAGLPALISINATQLERYSALFDRSVLVIDTVPEAHGPLRGILSCHKAKPAYDLFVTACDLPLLPAELITKLLTEKKASPDVPFAAFRTDFIEPLCALYSAEALADLLPRVVSGSLEAHCPRKILTAEKRTLILDAGSDGVRAFANMNRPEDLAAASART